MIRSSRYNSELSTVVRNEGYDSVENSISVLLCISLVVLALKLNMLGGE